jgi:hypothetical protein
VHRIIRQKQKSADYDTYLKKNYNSKEVEYIKNNAVFVGMSEKAMYESVGRPLRTNSTVVQNLSNKQCIYGDGVFIYVENGKVVGWQNIESLR